MTEYRFTLIIDSLGNNDAVISDEQMDALFEAGCDDATFGSVDGAQYADFVRESVTFSEALLSAIDAVESVPGLRVRRVEPDDIVTMSEIAERLGRSRESVRLLISGERGSGDFPHPISRLRSRNRLWRWSDVASWAYDEEDVEARENARLIAAVNAALELRTQLPSLHDLIESERDSGWLRKLWAYAASPLEKLLMFSTTSPGRPEERDIARGKASGMSCPFCDYEDTRVFDSRLSEGKDTIRRGRECLSCSKRFTTYERREPLRLMVLKKDGTREPFDRAKLHSGLTKACAKRRVAKEEIEFIVDEIEAELRDRQQHEVTSHRLRDMALLRLRKLDMVAYLRFASVYRQDVDMDRVLQDADVDEVQKMW